MSDELTAPRATRASWRVPALQALAIVALCLLLGVVAGLVWHWWWTPATGLVWGHQWQKGLIWIHPKTMAQGWSENAHQDVFAATGTYVVATAVAGLVVGLVSAVWLARAELVTLGSVVVGGAAGAAVAAWLGFGLSAADPTVLARHLPNQARLSDNLHWAGPWLVLVFPGAAMLVLGVVFLLVDRRPSREPTPGLLEPLPPGATVG